MKKGIHCYWLDSIAAHSVGGEAASKVLEFGSRA